MKLFTVFSALVTLASASPLSKRVGPSGQLITPYDGLQVGLRQGVLINYKRVNGDQGFYTETIDVDFQDKCGKTWRVASNITSAGRDENIVGYYGIPLPCDFPGYPSAGVGSGNIQVIITEHQIGQHGRVSFRAAAPTFQPTVFSGDECATLAGACGNTDEWMLL